MQSKLCKIASHYEKEAAPTTGEIRASILEEVEFELEVPRQRGEEGLESMLGGQLVKVKMKAFIKCLLWAGHCAKHTTTKSETVFALELLPF